MEKSNVVSICYVLSERISGFVRPVIYLERPSLNILMYKINMFYNVFDAKNFINKFHHNVSVIEVKKSCQIDVFLKSK